jgi:phage gp45-like
MADDRTSKLGTTERDATTEGHDTEHDADRTTYLRRGRTLSVSAAEGDEVVEIRSPGGMVELRVRLTEEGPVLQLDGVKLEVKAAESVDIECQRFSVKASEKAEISSGGDLEVRADKEMSLESTDDLTVRGKIIHLN